MTAAAAPDTRTLADFVIGMADNDLILAQQLGKLCGHGPNLETDIALTNISLDLFGQVRSCFQYAATLLGNGATEDTIAFLRKEHEYRNVLLVEQPSLDFGHIIVRQFLYDVFHHLLLERLQFSADETIAAIARKSIKETAYHVRFSADWLVRLGDGNDESRARAQAALDHLWPYADEWFLPTAVESAAAAAGIGADLPSLREPYQRKVAAVLREATLELPADTHFRKGGKQGIHTEHMGYILAEMQSMQRTYPGMQW
ncbi:MAG: phenylacetate-CoA oxygenase subunit PaaC [Verrucomicrobia bacterium]|nr:phenylacetate-CoA oxygenase subunit PaaC [Verrucomicrobiota bacterium]